MNSSFIFSKAQKPGPTFFCYQILVKLQLIHTLSEVHKLKVPVHLPVMSFCKAGIVLTRQAYLMIYIKTECIFFSFLRDVLHPENKNVRNTARVFICLFLFVFLVDERMNIVPHFE